MPSIPMRILSIFLLFPGHYVSMQGTMHVVAS